MNASPSTLTFLYSDIEGSTRRWEADPAAMSAALARHDALLQAAIAQAGGTVFKTVGDAFCAVFDSAADAVAAAVAAQRSLRAEDWAACGPGFAALKVRMALQTGEAQTQGEDWVGPAVDRVGQLLAAAHGGQALLGAAAAELAVEGSAAGSEPGADLTVATVPGCVLRDLGRHRFKDLGRPERIWQLVASGLPAAFPPILSLETHPHNLPEQASSFVGREAELAELTALLAQKRLVTVVGVGGSGKTRLAQQAAAAVLQRFPDGAWFVDLAPITAPEAVADRVAAILEPGERDLVSDLMRGKPGRGRAEVARVVAARLQGKRMLIILDNCEHVVAACARMAAALARYAPEVTVLATSREPLQIPEETLWPIAPLSTADPQTVVRAADPVAELSRYDSARLFIDRARSQQPDFVVTRATAGAVAEICQRLDGIPLALELAAARVRLLGPLELARRLNDRFRLLVRGSRVALPRQQTLRAMIDWSYELLSPVDQLVLQRMSVSAGPLPLAGAIAVGRGGAAGAPGTLDEASAKEAIDSLVGKSLLVAQTNDDGTWYRLLDTIRVYAAEQREPADGDRTQQGLQTWLLEWTDPWEPRMDTLHPNVRSAAMWAAGARDAADAAAGAKLAAQRHPWWTWDIDGQRALVRLRNRVDAVIAPSDMAMLYYIGGYASEDDVPEGGLKSFQEAARRFEEMGDGLRLGWASQDEAKIHLERGNLDEADRCFQRAIESKRGTAALWDIVNSLNGPAEVARLRGDWDAAASLNLAALAPLSAEEQLGGAALWSWHNQGHIKLRQGRVTEAALAFHRAMSINAPGPEMDLFICAPSLNGAGGVAASRGDGVRAARLMGAAAAILVSIQRYMEPADAADRDWNLARARTLLDDASWQAAWTEGQALTADEAALEALALLAEVAGESASGGHASTQT